MLPRKDNSINIKIGGLANELCAVLATNCNKNTRPPYPSLFYSVVEQDKITLVAAYETGHVPANTEAWIRTEAKKFFTKVNKKTKEKLKIPSKIFIVPRYDLSPPAQGTISEEKTIIQFAKNLKTLSLNNTLLQEVELIPTSEKKD